ncbi:MAG TPA: PilZ domain-containing protein [Thermodesulfobacteriota bacterium]|nr:PilZ domain-containing protein [Thermodesulfobacteriota bacterium]
MIKNMDATNKRISKRVPFRSIVKYGPFPPPEHTSFVVDLSDTGVGIRTNKVFKPGTELHMNFELDEKTTCHAVGIVQWAKTAPGGLTMLVKAGMGVRFTRMEEGLLAVYKEKAAD